MARVLPRRTDHDQRRALLAGAVQCVIAERGLDHASMRSIARASGFSTGVLQHYFTDKDALLRFALTAAVERVSARLAAIGAGTVTVETVREAVEATLPLDVERRQEWLVWLAFSARAAHDEAFGRVLSAHYAAWIDGFERLIADGVAAGTLVAHDEPRVVARRLVVVVEGLAAVSQRSPEVGRLARAHARAAVADLVH